MSEIVMSASSVSGVSRVEGVHDASRALSTPVIVGFVALHLVLGVGGALNRNVATAHFVLTVLVGLGAMFTARRLSVVVAVAAYGGVSDVYWRMTNSSAPWEASKYLFALGAVVLVVRFVRRPTRAQLPLVFLALLVPSMVLTIFAEGLGRARDLISFNEMGLISFGIGALAFRRLIASRTDAWNLGWIVTGPMVAGLGVVMHALITNPRIGFTDESNFAATGGYGPNQVSSLLGLLVLMCILLSFLRPARALWPLLVALGIGALWGSFLTFSRGGVYSLVLAGGGMLLAGVGSRGVRVRSLAALVVSATALVVVFTSANDFSGNWLRTRYEDSNTTGRSDIAGMDLDVLAAHPLLGVGSGRAPEFRARDSAGSGQVRLDTAAVHTEFTRVLAEHGVLGMFTLALLGAMLVQAYRRSRCQWNRLMVAGLSIWALTTMMHAATRLGAVSVMLALTQLRVEESPPSG